MASTAKFLLERAQNSTNETSRLIIESSSGNKTTELEDVFKALVFAQSKSVRTSTIILVSFNIVAALAIAGSILYDCYWASRIWNSKFEQRFSLRSIHPAETFPLILAIGIMLQGLVFAASQGEGLSSLSTSGCTLVSQFMFPALFIVPYLQFVFGAECTLRSFKKLPFEARGKHNVVMCLAIVSLMLVLTWIPSNLHPQPNICFASLVWFVSKNGQIAFILMTIITGMLLIFTGIIFRRLSTINMINEHQRIAASRMVYYLIVGIISLAFITPFFASLTFDKGQLKLSMMATVVLNLSGLMNGLLQLFLRSNTATSSFGPRADRARERRQFHIWGPNELAYGNHLVDPVDPLPGGIAVSRAVSEASLITSEKPQAIPLAPIRSPPPAQSPTPYNSLKSNAINKMALLPAIPSVPEVVETQNSSRSHAKKPSYSLFPTDIQSPTQSRLPVTAKTEEPKTQSFYDISDLTPPPRILGPDGQPVSRHRRDSSVMSSATVQIGLRLSHALQSSTTPSQFQDVSPESVPPVPSTSSKPACLSSQQDAQSLQVHLPKPPPPSSRSSLSPKTVLSDTRLPTSPGRPHSPLLQIKTQNLPSGPLRGLPGPMPQFTPPVPMAMQTSASLRPSPLASNMVITPPGGYEGQPPRSQPEAQRMMSPSYDKILPPTPSPTIASIVNNQMRSSSSFSGAGQIRQNARPGSTTTAVAGVEELLVLSPTVYTPTPTPRMERSGSGKSVNATSVGRSGSGKSLREIRRPDERDRRRGEGDWL